MYAHFVNLYTQILKEEKKKKNREKNMMFFLQRSKLSTHLYLYLLFNCESSLTAAVIFKGQICVIMN